MIFSSQKDQKEIRIQEYQKQLLDAIAKNKLDMVISELRGIFADNPEKKNKVIMLAFKLSSIKNYQRMQTIKRENYKIEYNRVSESLLTLVNELENHEIFIYLFESKYESYPKAKMPESRLKKAARHMKKAIFILFGGLLFWVNGADVFTEELEKKSCTIRVEQIVFSLDSLVANGDLAKAMDELNNQLSSTSRWYILVPHLIGQLDGVNRDRWIRGEDFNVEYQTIAFSFLEIVDNLACEDIR